MKNKMLICVGLGVGFVAAQGLMTVFKMESISQTILSSIYVFGVIAFMWMFKEQTSTSTDSKYYSPNIEQLNSAVFYAQNIMRETGWTLEDYRQRWKDCDDYAEKQCSLMKEWFYSNVPTQAGYGLGISPFSFIRKDGKGHVIVECYLKKGKSMFFDVYPDHPALYRVSSKEAKSADWVNF